MSDSMEQAVTDLESLKAILFGKELKSLRDTINNLEVKVATELAKMNREMTASLDALKADVEGELKSMHHLLDEEKATISRAQENLRIEMKSLETGSKNDTRTASDTLDRRIAALATDAMGKIGSLEKQLVQLSADTAAKSLKNDQMVSFLTNFATTLSGGGQATPSFAPHPVMAPPAPVAYAPVTDFPANVDTHADDTFNLESQDFGNELPQSDDFLSNFDDAFNLGDKKNG